MTTKGPDPLLWCFLRPLMSDDGAFSAVAAEDVGHSGHPFGGFLLGLAAWAAILDAPGRFPHALHGFFLRPLRAGVALHGQVSSLRDGRGFSQRQISLSQDGRTVFAAIVSLQASRDSMPRPPALVTHALDADAPEVCAARPLPFPTRAVARFLDIRIASAAPLQLWVRPHIPLPDDHAAHYAALAAMTDVGPARVSPPGPTGGDGASRQSGGLTLGHSIWFHGRPQLDGWVLLSLDGVPSGGGRGLTVGTALSQDGSRCATYVQEVLGAGGRGLT
jgi:acyl-CoA thioesterase II